MATVVWHGLYSCSDQQHAELPQTTVTALRLKLAPQKHADLGGWRFMQSLSVNRDVTHTKPNDATGNGKREGFDPRTLSSVKLSEKSMEMCTENLGCETGTDVITDGDTDIYPSFMSSPNSVNSDGKSPTRQTRQQSMGKRKVNSATRIFPPPLTTMHGAERVLIRSHREEGRLVMDAVKCPSSRSSFVADRSHGRLRLSLLRSEESRLDSDKLEVGNEEAELIKTDCTELLHENQFRQENERGPSLDINIQKPHTREEKEEEEAESTGRFQRLPTISRCMEGEHEHHHRRHHHQSKELMNIRLCVATS